MYFYLQTHIRHIKAVITQHLVTAMLKHTKCICIVSVYALLSDVKCIQKYRTEKVHYNIDFPVQSKQV